MNNVESYGKKQRKGGILEGVEGDGIIFIPLVLMGFLLNYVESMVIPSIPSLQVDFHTTTALSSWIIAAFLITGSVSAPLFGKLGDNHGKKKMLLVSLSVYTIGVGLAGFSTSMVELIIARALQGVGFGGIPLAFAIIIDIFPTERVGMAQGVMSAFFATGGVAGLVAGSYIKAYLGWQWTFHSALIVSIVILAAIVIIKHRDVVFKHEKIDYPGAALLTIGLTLILLFITRGSTIGWTTTLSISLITAGLILAALFIVRQKRASKPLINLRLMSKRNVMIANVEGTIAMLMLQLMFLSVVYYTGDPKPFGAGDTTIMTGLILAPGAVAMAIVGPLMGRMIKRIGPKPIVMIGAALLIMGLVTFLTERNTLVGLIISGAGIWTGIVSVFVPTVNMVAMDMPPDKRAIGMGTNMMIRNMGGSVGPTLSSSIMTIYSASIAAPALAGGAKVSGVSFPTGTAFDYLMYIGLALAAAMILVNLLTRNYTLQKKH